MAEVATRWVVVGAHRTRIPGEWGRESNQPPGQNAKNHLYVFIVTVGGVLRCLIARLSSRRSVSSFGRLVVCSFARSRSVSRSISLSLSFSRRPTWLSTSIRRIGIRSSSRVYQSFASGRPRPVRIRPRATTVRPTRGSSLSSVRRATSLLQPLHSDRAVERSVTEIVRV